MSNLTSLPDPIAVRVLSEFDATRIQLLAELDSATAPHGDLLGAEAEGELVAVLSLTDGRVISNPFRVSAPAVELLRLRATQLEAPRRGLERLLRRRTPRARASLAGSPPGAGGRLLQL